MVGIEILGLQNNSKYAAKSQYEPAGADAPADISQQNSARAKSKKRGSVGEQAKGKKNQRRQKAREKSDEKNKEKYAILFKEYLRAPPAMRQNGEQYF